MKNKSLYKICEDIAFIEEEYVYDPSWGFVADMIDTALSIIGFDVFHGKTPDLDDVEDCVYHLEMINNQFQIEKLNEPIQELKNYIEEHK